MNCPACGTSLSPIAERCPSCGMRFAVLTVEQRNALQVHVIMPCLILAVSIVVLGLIAACVLGPFFGTTVGKIVAGILVVMAAVMTWAVTAHVRANRADVQLGVALVKDARLTRAWSTSQSPRVHYGEFEGIGKLRLPSEVAYGLVEGGVYTVTYSPNIRHAWSATPLHG